MHEEIKQSIRENETYIDKFRGCLIGGAAGDALGYEVEFMRYKEIIAVYGTDGITKYELHNGEAWISDDTQMTLFTATGLLLGKTRGMTRGIGGKLSCYPGFAYKTWYRMQMHMSARDESGYAYSWLADIPEMGERRAPGSTCMSAIGSGRFGTPDEPINHSKGCGGVMRVAPVGLYLNRPGEIDSTIDDVDICAAEVAALTHGHELGWLPSAMLAHIINRLVYTDMDLLASIRDAEEKLQALYGDRIYLSSLIKIVDEAVLLSSNDWSDIDNIRELGEGWVAEETLAIAIYCALKYQNDFSKALCVSVNHDGDSDSTGAVTGNILGAIYGYEAIPEQWKKRLECKGIILEVADDLCRDCYITEYGDYHDEDWKRKYIENRWR